MSPKLPFAIEDRPTPNFERGRGGELPQAVVIHTTDGTLEGTATWFGESESGVSSHWLVGLDGRVLRFVHEADTARHAGRVVDPTTPLVDGVTDPNRITIGIEFEDDRRPQGPRPDSQYEAGGRLLAGIASRWEIPLDREHVIGHREICAVKECPGSVDIDRLITIARAASPAVNGR